MFGNNSFGSGLGGGGGGGFSGSGMGTMNMGNLGQNNQNNQNNQTTMTTTMLGDTVRVMADHINNTLLVRATPAEYERIESTLKRLDVQRAQVLVEASIVEVTLNNDLQYGLEWSFSNNHIGINGNKYTGTGSLVNGTAAATGFTWALSNATGINAQLRALADKSLIKVISSPSLLVLDNQTAAIQVGNQQPISTGTVINTASDFTSTSIQYQNTGVMLAVTPAVTAGDLVTMNISQMVSDLDKSDASATPGYPTFMQRQINTQVAVRSGETIVLGGLIKDSASSGNSGLPFLSNIPVLGALFGTHSTSAQRTELLVIITPRVLRSDQDARAVSREMRDRMRGLTSQDLPVPTPPGTP
jgi:general secretion pathway protein D